MKSVYSLLCGSALMFATVALANPPASAPSTAEAAKPADDGGYFRAGFNRLASYSFVPPEPEENAKPGTPPPSGANQIPAAIKALDGQKVIVTGFVMPLKMEKGLTTELLLVSSPQLCCYGVTPQMNEFVVVKMKKDAGVKPPMDVPVDFYGKLTVKEVFEDGYLSNIYTLEGDKMGKSAVE